MYLIISVSFFSDIIPLLLSLDGITSSVIFNHLSDSDLQST